MLAEILFCLLLLRSERLRVWADVLCCGLVGAFIHFVLLQFGKIRAEEWEILSASILVLGFAFMGWSATRTGVYQNPNKDLAESSDPFLTPTPRESGHSMHDERLKNMGEMSARFVHEISQPLSVMMLRIEEMKRARRNLDDKALEKSMNNIEVQLQHLIRLSKALKDFASSDAQIQPGFVQLEEVFALTRNLTDAWTMSQGVEFRWPTKVPLIEVSGGTTLHAQILLNLIKNAFDAVSELPEGTKRWIDVKINERGGGVEISVSNAGAPISRRVQIGLFKPFFSTKRMGQGLGLGLSICQQLVHSVGGEIWYDERAPHPCFVVRYSFLPSVRGISAEQGSELDAHTVQKVA